MKKDIKKRPIPKTIPFRQELFWDVNPKTIDFKRHARYIIERILDFGNDDEVRWMWHYYSHDLLKDVVKNSRVLHLKSRAFWALMLKIKIDPKSYAQPFWPY